ncbi:membrane protein [Mucilaginibacter galii]|uniref:Membrane protein n=1 Tax=Mucilaginibacter galii TaxID=2005073 RepID=A0A917JDC4_9SPHI|nr:RagB/SusD family nutrient uptake outer membrane protein [Mucilaginibacter galii]GGI51629.1 membrane protein [Mucilaginibacter galii]
MKINYIILAAFAGTALFSSCKKVLDKVDEGKGTAGQVYSDSVLAKQAVDYLYGQNLPTWGGNGADGGTIPVSLTGLTDETTGDNRFLQGVATSADEGSIGTSNTNSNFYGKMRIINTFIRDCRAGSLPTAQKNRFIAQALFFRAFKYFSMVRVYGGVPLVLEPLSSVGEDNKVEAQQPRATTSACITQITADLDSAIKYLPTKWPNANDWGHITSGAAAAFKGRVLLTWASPQFNPARDQARWQAAYDASTQAITLLNQGGFGLFVSTGSSGAGGGTNAYANMWFTEINNPEAVMVTGYNTSIADQARYTNTYDKSVRPAYLGAGSGSSQPTWDFVRNYLMKDGKDTLTSKYGKSAAGGYSLQTFWKNRDPRFDWTIAYNGCTWPTLGVSNYRLWTYIYYTKADRSTFASTESSGQTSTGFYLRKATNAITNASDLANSGTDWMEIRYAEVLMNQAEAAAEIGRLGAGQEAYTNIIAIRKRAGIEPGTDNLYGLTAGLNRDDMIKTIMNERAVEFAYEGKRFWDLQRRNQTQSLLNFEGRKARYGITISLKTVPATDYAKATRDATSMDDLYANTFDVKVNRKLDTKYPLNWQSNYVFFGIPPATITNNPAIIQTNGWDLGGFDPLK